MTREEIIKGLLDIHAVTANYKGDQVIIHSMPMTRLTAILNGAVELLKAETPRVMTWKELVAANQYGMPIVVESKYDGIIENCYFIRVKSQFWAWTHQRLPSGGYPKDYYGFTWRCWTCRPSTEEMEAIPWES